MIVQQKANTGSYIDYFLRLADIKKQIDRMNVEREKIGELMRELVSSPAGVDPAWILAATGLNTLQEIDRKTIDYMYIIRDLDEAERRREHSALGGVFYRIECYQGEIDRLSKQRVKLSSMGVLA